MEQFEIRITKLLKKLERIETMYKKEDKVPDFFWTILNEEREKLLGLKEKYKKEEISPEEFL